MKKRLSSLFVIMIVATILGACSNYKFKPDVNYPIEDFTMTDHRGNTVTLEDFKGEPWLAMFIFTNCTTVCPPMTFNMTEIQSNLIERGVEDYKIVAFSVDPEFDTPEVLTNYLSLYPVPDDSKWHLLTGYDQTFIEQFALDSFKTLVKKPADGGEVMHMVTFHLVDEKGTLVKNYSGYSEAEGGVPFDTIAIDIKTLIEDRLGK
ncbi:SCO family protein [Ureibacillus manganicus]|uniref:Cysteine ABC transporter ATP-binding protein n=1 Tax=Ureibacillus manganicus DSM 26584 TaxID=1384049 RepID=A0A0A3HYY9_9BACL|nr:SCO family protein [Ureibacillus manganicus]KGR77776.1 cysteine ABC transporter ATP-binding protein [Ureibacillus manganicus DSM 26584]